MNDQFATEHSEDTAVISECGRYRYSLTRRINPNRHTWCVFIMLNPSTADATTDDPTIRACMEFARRWECGWLQVVNLYAWRATDPADLSALDEPVITGPMNKQALHDAIRNADIIVAAWGTHAGARSMAREVGTLLRQSYTAHHLGLNKDGSPKHPLYVKRSTPLALWEETPCD